MQRGCKGRGGGEALFRPFLPVVQQDVRSPDLVCGEAEVLHAGMFALVPLEVVVEPALRHTHKDTVWKLPPPCFWINWDSFNSSSQSVDQGLHLHVKRQIIEMASA